MITAERLSESNIFEFARGLPSDAVELDLSRMHVERVAASILVGCLLTSGADLRLKLPPGDKRELLARNGLLFALANRRGRVDLQPAADAQRWLEEWRRPWTRGTREPLLRLSEDQPSGPEPSVFGRDYAAFINPHRAGGGSNATSGVAEVVRPWLHRMLPKLTTDEDRSPAGAEFVQSVGRVINELVENVSEHAAARHSLAVHSLVLVSVARGGEPTSRYRLYILVIDTGPGILDTAITKISAVDPSRTSWSAAERKALFENLFLGKIERLGRARGFGLPEVLETASRWEGGRLVSVSNGFLLRTHKEGLHTEQVEPVMNGSLVSLMLPLPPQLRVRKP